MERKPKEYNNDDDYVKNIKIIVWMWQPGKSGK